MDLEGGGGVSGILDGQRRGNRSVKLDAAITVGGGVGAGLNLNRVNEDSAGPGHGVALVDVNVRAGNGAASRKGTGEAGPAGVRQGLPGQAVDVGAGNVLVANDEGAHGAAG